MDKFVLIEDGPLINLNEIITIHEVDEMVKDKGKRKKVPNYQLHIAFKNGSFFDVNYESKERRKRDFKQIIDIINICG